MNRKRKAGRLHLSRQTIRALSRGQLGQAAGGTAETTTVMCSNACSGGGGNTCNCCTNSDSCGGQTIHACVSDRC